jgi:hypothetical protein
MQMPCIARTLRDAASVCVMTSRAEKLVFGLVCGMHSIRATPEFDAIQHRSGSEHPLPGYYRFWFETGDSSPVSRPVGFRYKAGNGP